MTKIFIIIEDGANPGEIRYQQFSDVELNPDPAKRTAAENIANNITYFMKELNKRNEEFQKLVTENDWKFPELEKKDG